MCWYRLSVSDLWINLWLWFFLVIKLSFFGIIVCASAKRDSAHAKPESRIRKSPAEVCNEMIHLHYSISSCLYFVIQSDIVDIMRPVYFSFAGTLFDNLKALRPAGPIRSALPLSYEILEHPYGFVLYRTVIQGRFRDPAKLSVPGIPSKNGSPDFTPGIRDRGIVFVDQVHICFFCTVIFDFISFISVLLLFFWVFFVFFFCIFLVFLLYFFWYFLFL